MSLQSTQLIVQPQRWDWKDPNSSVKLLTSQPLFCILIVSPAENFALVSTMPRTSRALLLAQVSTIISMSSIVLVLGRGWDSIQLILWVMIPTCTWRMMYTAHWHVAFIRHLMVTGLRGCTIVTGFASMLIFSMIAATLKFIPLSVYKVEPQITSKPHSKPTISWQIRMALAPVGVEYVRLWKILIVMVTFHQMRMGIG